MATKPEVKPPTVEAPNTEPTATEAGDAQIDPAARLDHAKNVVQRNVYWAMGAGVLPLPIFDIVAISGVQLKMIRELSTVYGFKFSEGVAKKAVMSLLVGIGGVGIGGVIGMSFAKFVPFIGLPLGIASVPVVSGMLTHAVGRTFVMHFEAGGTLLDFDPKKMRDYFKQEFDNAKVVVTEIQKKGASEPARPSV